MTKMLQVYIAGPDVFFPKGDDVMRQKGELALRYGFAPSTMAENDLDPTGVSAFAFGSQISAANERMMRESDFVIANLTPFRGIAADVGTAFEVGFMRALGKPLFAYTNTIRGYFERLTEDFYQGQATRQSDGYIRGPDGMMVENHGMVDNLMLDASVDASGGVLIRREVSIGDLYRDVSAFEECLIEAKRRLS